jgi:hypothetical protein
MRFGLLAPRHLVGHRPAHVVPHDAPADPDEDGQLQEEPVVAQEGIAWGHCAADRSLRQQRR